MKSRLLLDVIIRKSATIFQLLSCKDQTLLIWWDTFLVLDLLLNVVDGVAWLNVKSNSFTCEGFNEDLQTSTKTKNEMKSRLLLDVIIRKSATIFQLLSYKDQTLLIWWDTLLVLDLLLNVVDGVAWLNVKGDSFTCEGFDEDLHTSTETEHKVQS